MSEQVPTVKVKMKGDKSKETFVINMTDFNKDKHEMVKGEELPPLKPLDPAQKESLYGSSKQPSSWKLDNGSTVQLGDVVRAAFEKSGLTEEQWNAIPQDDRESHIAAMVKEMIPSPPPFKVAKRGRGNATKFFVINTVEGTPVGEEEYATEAEALNKITELTQAA
jgi:hypothetical protein